MTTPHEAPLTTRGGPIGLTPLAAKLFQIISTGRDDANLYRTHDLPLGSYGLLLELEHAGLIDVCVHVLKPLRVARKRGAE